MKNIGFLGLGLMGLPIAINVVKGTGQSILGFDVMQDKKDRFKEAGGTPVDDPMEIYTSCDIIFTSLPTHAIIINSIEGAIKNGKPGNIIVDLSSTAPNIVTKLNDEAQEAGMELLDSPISGGEPGAKNGTLAIMTGGNKEAFDEVLSILECMGKPVYTGPSTTGSITKLANNLIAGAMLVAIAEGYGFAAKAGLDPEVLFRATRTGFVGGPLYDDKIPKLINRNFEPGARIAVHRKDIINAKNYAHELGIDLPLTDVVLNVMDWMDDNGMINIDQIGMVKYYEKKMDTVVQKKH
ncbi:MAG TPA: NAD(P)-binding domain-containing protein [Clostridium sp.]|uniref:NAD(P)-dependent oxidoreductase n=1 Tax=Clostridium sp. TaxID=1506 RepID=UPI002F91EDF7